MVKERVSALGTALPFLREHLGMADYGSEQIRPVGKYYASTKAGHGTSTGEEHRHAQNDGRQSVEQKTKVRAGPHLIPDNAHP